MSVWLVVNGFLHSPKFDEIYQLLLDALQARGIPVRLLTNDALLTPTDSHPLKSIIHSIEDSSLPPLPQPDVVLFWDKDIPLGLQLEGAGLRLMNPARGIARCDDKAFTTLALAGSGIRVPKTIVAPMTYGNVGFTNRQFLDRIGGELGWPLVIKSRRGSFGGQVHLVHSPQELAEQIDRFPDFDLLFQEFIPSSFGRDLRIQTLGGRVVASVLREGAEGDFRSNVTAGGRMTPFQPPETFLTAAITATRHLGLDFAGVDLLFGPEGEPVLCEVNSNPHFKNLLDATGINFADSLADYILRKDYLPKT